MLPLDAAHTAQAISPLSHGQLSRPRQHLRRASQEGRPATMPITSPRLSGIADMQAASLRRYFAATSLRDAARAQGSRAGLLTRRKYGMQEAMCRHDFAIAMTTPALSREKPLADMAAICHIEFRCFRATTPFLLSSLDDAPSASELFGPSKK